MRIGLYHGYELTGSGSNEYTRYLAENLKGLGHEVHIICREPTPESIPFIDRAFSWDRNVGKKSLFIKRNSGAPCVLHQLAHAAVRPVYVTDKQRSGNVKSFVSLTDDELNEYHSLNQALVTAILSEFKMDILHANHLIYQPVAALEACRVTGTPLVIYPHGSSIEYVIKNDARYKERALQALLGCRALISGNGEVRDRILTLYPRHREELLRKIRIVGVGVDTGLFKPIEKERRNDSIIDLMKRGAGGGKDPELTKELQLRLDNMDVEAVRDYWDKYNHSQPDADLNTHLKRIPWDEFIILFVGALTAGKGLQSVIVALPAILLQHPATHLIIVGSGAYREVLEGLTHALISANKKLLLDLCERGLSLDRSGLSGPWEDAKVFLSDPVQLKRVLECGRLLRDHVHFIGRLDHPLLKHLFPCADLAIFPSIIPEAYPLVLMESLANGVLPMVSYFSGLKDGIDELEPLLGHELIFKMKISVDPLHRVQSLVSNISGLRAQPYSSSYRRKLREIAVERYDWKKRASRLVRTYSSLIEGVSEKSL
ncbi:MAG: glycosyltransferase family 4 protein [Spirochaetales bacterium]|nr:glycosyltransferase family 4 protein [Spirochaetales bacterium]